MNIFDIVFTNPIFNGLVLLYHLFGDFGLSIVVLTIIIKLVLFPLTLRQLKSTKAMQVLQPQIAELQKKYAKDRQGLALASQQLYKEYGVNPLAGCLPLLIQLPVLYGLYFALSALIRNPNLTEINARLYFFVPHFKEIPSIMFNWFSWIPFLPESLKVFSLAKPDPTHILPILAGLATFISLRMAQPKTAPTPASGNNSDMANASMQTMKTMQYIMPLITVFFGWTFPAGLALYWTVSSIFQAVQQYFVTGWGSLLTTPNLKTPPPANKKVVESTARPASTTKNSARTAPTDEEDDEDEEDEDAADGTNGTNSTKTTRPTPRPGTTYTRRRSRGSSSSARRRSAQRSRG